MNSRNRSIAARRMPVLMAGLLALLPGAAVTGAVIGEPETVVYGRILNRQNPNLDQLVSEGELRWTIRKPDGTMILLSGTVAEMDGGNHSYFVRIPHQAMVLGQEPSELTVPLGNSEQMATHALITLDGNPLKILPPATSAFKVEMILRATALRLDLEVGTVAEDSDGDGLPDWWEDEHGLDKQDPGDALTDLNGNGLNNLGEFLAGIDPNHDGNQPQLLTREVIAYSTATSLVLLEAADGDSTPEQLVYSLRSVPQGGLLLLRNASALPGPTGRELAAGSEFTQADVLAGRLVFEHGESGVPGSFEVGVRDEVPEHEEAVGEIAVLLFDPLAGMVAANAEEGLRLEAHRLASRHGHLVADLGATTGIHRLNAPTASLSPVDYQVHARSFGEESPHILLGGPSDDIFCGGAGDDFLHGAAGNNTFTGGAGADSFLFTDPSASNQVITDFDPDEGDLIDLSGVLDGSSMLLTDYVRLRRSGNDALLELCADGTNVGFDDLVIRLQGSPLLPDELPDLYYGGNLVTGDIGLPPRFGIEAVTPLASENGPVDGEFMITREGCLEEALSVKLLISGNATNGVDYQSIPSSVWFPAGATAVGVVVQPYVDAAVEFNEMVFIELASSPGYLLAGACTAQLTIEDLKPQIALQVIERLASVSAGTPGALLMRRSGLLSPEVFVQFTLAGTAVNGVDYDYVAPYLSLSPGQATRMIEFRPKPGVNFGAAEAKNIRMTVIPDSAYALSAPSAEVMIVPEKLDYASWLAENGFPAGGDGGGVGGSEMPLLMRYGFSVDPRQPNAPETRQRLPEALIEDGYLTIRFRRKPAIADVLYRVEYSTDFQQWSSGPEVVEEITSQVAPDDPGAAVFRAKRPVSDAAAAGMRVRLDLPGDN